MNYRTAKIFRNGGSQAVRIPHAFQLQCEDVWIWREPGTDDVVLSPRLPDWGPFLIQLRWGDPTQDFLSNLDQRLPRPGAAGATGAAGPAGSAKAVAGRPAASQHPFASGGS